jgi:CheY-like chemotaxis protein
MSLVLVADDEPAVLEVLSEVVLDMGHEVLRAADGREALKLARAQRPDLVITDHMMPRMSGADLCRQLRRDEALAHVPVILLSAALTEGIPEAQAFLAKPFELSEFEALVRRTLEGAAAAARGEGAEEVGQTAEGAPTDRAVEGLRAPLAAARAHLARLREVLAAAGGPTPPLAAGPLEALAGELDVLERGVRSLADAAAPAASPAELGRAPEELARLLHGAVVERPRSSPALTLALQAPEGLEPGFEVAGEPAPLPPKA